MNRRATLRRRLLPVAMALATLVIVRGIGTNVLERLRPYIVVGH